MVCGENYESTFVHIPDCIQSFALMGSIYTTLMISLERYLGTCHPFMKFRRKITIYVVPVLIATFCFHLPYFFDCKYYFVNDTLHIKGRTWYDDTYVKRYYGWTIAFVFDIIPLPVIICLNALIIQKVRKPPHILIGIIIGNTEYKDDVTKTLLLVVGVFLFIRSADIIVTMLTYFGRNEDEFRVKWMFIDPIVKLMLILNSAINFVIYCLVGTKFRYEFLQVFGFKSNMSTF